MVDKISLNFEVIKEIFLYKFNRSILPFFCKTPVVETMDNTLEKLINGYSISRYGDGEIDVILGRTQGFQRQNKKLANRLKHILKENGKYEKFIVGIPGIFESMECFTDEAKIHWEIRLNKEKYRWYYLLNRKRTYGNSQITRFYFDWRVKTNSQSWLKKLLQIWENRDLLIVEGNKSRLGVGNNLFDNAKSIERILCPSENAFDAYEKILEEVLKEDKNKIVLIALGPTASVLSYDLFLNGYQAIDIGHVDIEYEWYLTQTTTKIAIKGKYVNEVSGGNDVNDVIDSKYLSEIKSTILNN